MTYENAVDLVLVIAVARHLLGRAPQARDALRKMSRFTGAKRFTPKNHKQHCSRRLATYSFGCPQQAGQSGVLPATTMGT